MLVCINTGDQLFCGFRGQPDPDRTFAFTFDTPVGEVWTILTGAQRSESASPS